MTRRSTTRVQIELPEGSMERLRALKEKTEATSYAEVTKNAFKLYERMVDLTERGHRFCVRNPDGTTTDLELFI